MLGCSYTFKPRAGLSCGMSGVVCALRAVSAVGAIKERIRFPSGLQYSIRWLSMYPALLPLGGNVSGALFYFLVLYRNRRPRARPIARDLYSKATTIDGIGAVKAGRSCELMALPLDIVDSLSTLSLFHGEETGSGSEIHFMSLLFVLCSNSTKTSTVMPALHSTYLPDTKYARPSST